MNPYPAHPCRAIPANRIRPAKRALRRGLKLASEANAWLLVTGSLYLVGALRNEVGAAAQCQR
jgi:folylpolyglutamate synthase/dihydropteroate synthase